MFFFFSSRRRHTRWPRDWSSDVCSSDLHPHEGGRASDSERLQHWRHLVKADQPVLGVDADPVEPGPPHQLSGKGARDHTPSPHRHAPSVPKLAQTAHILRLTPFTTLKGSRPSS